MNEYLISLLSNVTSRYGSLYHWCVVVMCDLLLTLDSLPLLGQTQVQPTTQQRLQDQNQVQRTEEEMGLSDLSGPTSATVNLETSDHSKVSSVCRGTSVYTNRVTCNHRVTVTCTAHTPQGHLYLKVGLLRLGLQAEGPSSSVSV